MSNAPRRAGRHYLQIPGPTPVPDRILRAMDMPVIDHRGPEFKALGLKVLAGIKTIFKTTNPVFIYPSSGPSTFVVGGPVPALVTMSRFSSAPRLLSL